MRVKNTLTKSKKILISLTLLKDEMRNLFLITNELSRDEYNYDITIAFHPRNQNYMNKLVDSHLSIISKTKSKNK